MLVIKEYLPAVLACLLAMLCWGSWSNAQKLVSRDAPVAHFYRDYIFGIALMSLLLAFTVGSLGNEGRPFLDDLTQANVSRLLLALAAGVVFNTGNRLLVAGIQLAGIAIAMPVGTGLSLVLGLVVNYIAEPEGKVGLLAAGGAVVILAMVFGGLAYKAKDDDQGFDRRGVVIVLLSGLLTGFFFRMITSTLAPDLAQPAAGTLTPSTAFVAFSIGLLLSNPLLEGIVRRYIPEEKEDETADVNYTDLSTRQHLYGLAGGLIWGIGMGALLLASQPAGNAISFGLSQGATIVAVLYGLFVWKEFDGAPPATNRWLWLMGGCYVAGIVLIVIARL
ncbi:GRP family sugar transporter [Spirosoma sp. KUDC1026]|uniref:GRP family sugar transporter n=1 Tax=Spirosoma sp. KUDC1026 TaxID=2745947 RepID=UPI00159BB020|nr:GRP family sugar transporter [Spirosoma sp. KUDC1026]QKZ13010.1 multidrug DMT transporter permease [Spirosoma sp. KUDC1026]